MHVEIVSVRLDYVQHWTDGEWGKVFELARLVFRSGNFSLCNVTEGARGYPNLAFCQDLNLCVIHRVTTSGMSKPSA